MKKFIYLLLIVLLTISSNIPILAIQTASTHAKNIEHNQKISILTEQEKNLVKQYTQRQNQMFKQTQPFSSMEGYSGNLPGSDPNKYNGFGPYRYYNRDYYSPETNQEYDTTSIGTIKKPTEIYNENVSSMVYIKTQNAIGSGVIVKSDGTLVTCFHVIADADYIKVRLANGREFHVDGFKYINPLMDIAVLTINAPDVKFKPIDIKMGTPIIIGEKIYTLSNPRGLEFVFSDGMINQYSDEYIQFSAPVSKGSSGGALINERGELIGIITSLFKDSQNINFAVPVKYFLPRLNNTTVVNRYYSNWTDFVLANASEKQLHLYTEYALKKADFFIIYKTLLPFTRRVDFPKEYYSFIGLCAFLAYRERLDDETILKDAIRFYEKSISYNVNLESSSLALVLLYGLNSEAERAEKPLRYLYMYHPQALKVIDNFLDNTSKCSTDACVYKYMDKYLRYLMQITFEHR